MSRYSGKPFLRLIECYVLDEIGQLTLQHGATLEAMEPKLRATYGSPGTWKQIVAEQMSFDDSFGQQVKALWAGYLAHAKEIGRCPDPNEFVVSFVDQNSLGSAWVN
jgi:hypothetical protein